MVFRDLIRSGLLAHSRRPWALAHGLRLWAQGPSLARSAVPRAWRGPRSAGSGAQRGPRSAVPSRRRGPRPPSPAEGTVRDLLAPQEARSAVRGIRGIHIGKHGRRDAFSVDVLGTKGTLTVGYSRGITRLTDESGNVVSWSSAGSKGFKGSRKSTPYAAQVAADDAGAKAFEQGLRTLTVQVKGPGSGRETALRSLQSKGFKILSIKDTTPMPHNGTRPPKKRRV